MCFGRTENSKLARLGGEGRDFFTSRLARLGGEGMDHLVAKEVWSAKDFSKDSSTGTTIDRSLTYVTSSSLVPMVDDGICSCANTVCVFDVLFLVEVQAEASSFRLGRLPDLFFFLGSSAWCHVPVVRGVGAVRTVMAESMLNIDRLPSRRELLDIFSNFNRRRWRELDLVSKYLSRDSSRP